MQEAEEPWWAKNSVADQDVTKRAWKKGVVAKAGAFPCILEVAVRFSVFLYWEGKGTVPQRLGPLPLPPHISGLLSICFFPPTLQRHVFMQLELALPSAAHIDGPMMAQVPCWAWGS